MNNSRPSSATPFTLMVFTILRLVGVEPDATTSVGQTTIYPEPLVWVGNTPPSQAESQALLQLIEQLDKEPQWAEWEAFIAAHPDSPWAPSVQAQFAYWSWDRGLNSVALRHWEAAWEATRQYTDGKGKAVADFTLAYWTKLLASLGRVEKLGEIFKETKGRILSNQTQMRMFEQAREAYGIMMTHPALSYRCGTFSLAEVGRRLPGANSSLNKLIGVPSPASGFTLTRLVELSQEHQLGLAAVERPPTDQTLVAPSIVHWSENHYSAICERNNDLFLVADPTFGQSRWLRADVINQEASGIFLVPSDQKPVGWRGLSGAETDKVFGKGYPNYINDGLDEGCKKAPGSSQKECPPCRGVPAWWISEPYINLWISDSPVVYMTSLAREIEFRLSYKQRDTRPSQSADRVPPTGWNHDWFSYVRVNDLLPYSPPAQIYQQYSATLYEAGGGERYYSNQNKDDEGSRTRLEPLRGTSYAPLESTAGEDGFAGFRLIHPDGSQDIYGIMLLSQNKVQGLYPKTDALLTQQIDRYGNTNRFLYEGTNGIFRLQYMVDFNGKTNTLRYTTNSLVSEAENPYTKKATFQYDSNKQLTNITDVANLTSWLRYDANGWPTNLVTPYGTNGFTYTVAPDLDQGNFGGHNRINRAIEIAEPNTGKQLFIYRFDSPDFLPSAFPTNEIPVGTPLGTIDDGRGSTNVFQAASFRNSFHWGQKQYASLSTAVLTNLTTSDYRLAGMRHWLQDTNDLTVGEVLSMERDPSPDSNGSTEGQKSWYDYPGKTEKFRAGTEALPAVVARVLPNGETSYTWLRYNKAGYPTNIVSTYGTAGGTIQTRTNTFVFDSNIATNTWTQNGGFVLSSTYTNYNLLISQTNGNNQLVNRWGGFGLVTNTFTATNLSGTNVVTSVSKRTRPDNWTNALQEVTQYLYGDRQLVIRKIDPAALTVTNIYNSDGSLQKTIALEINNTNSFTYSNGLLRTRTDELGATITNTYDDLIRLIRMEFSGNTYITNSYDKLDVVRTVDRLGYTNLFAYNRIRQLISYTNALGVVTGLGYCGCGALEYVTNAVGTPLERVTHFEYDNQSNPTHVFYPDSSLTNRFNLLRQLTHVSHSAGISITNWYNHQGLLLASSNAFGQITKYTYDMLDRPTNTVDLSGVTVTNTFDLLHRLLTRGYPDTGMEAFTYSTRGLVNYTNQLGKFVHYGYDAARRLSFETNANNEVIQYKYDPAGNLTNLIDGKLQSTFWGFDQFGRLTSKTNAANAEVLRYQYDANDRLTNRWTTAKGNAAYSYDKVGSLVAIDYANSTDVAFQYDALNHLTNMVDAAGTTRFTFSNAGLLASEDGPWSDDAISFSYNNRLRSNLTLLQPNASSWFQDYGYDAALRLRTVASPAGAFSYDYLAGVTAGITAVAPLIQKLLLPNGSYVTNVYDSVGRLSDTWLKNNTNGILNRHSYAYNTGGQRTRQTFTDGNYVDYTYDDIGQLLTATGKESGGTINRLHEQLAYGYDAANNLSKRTNNGFVQTFGANNKNELTNITRSGALTVAGGTTSSASSVTVNSSAAALYADKTFARTNLSLADGNNTFTAVGSDSYGRSDTDQITLNLPATLSFTYDGNGNLTGDGRRTFTYDDENRLTSILVTNGVNSTLSTNIYDGLSRRRIRREFSWVNSKWEPAAEIRYVYDGNLVIQERDANNIPRVSYTRGSDLSASREGAGGVGGLLARTDHGQLATGSGQSHAFYHADGGGNITALLNAQQLVVGRYRYDPYGNLLSQSGPLAIANLYRFASKESHLPSGTYYFGQRFYDPNLQRFLNQDPLQEAGGLNLFAFVHNSPLNRLDPWGLDDAMDELNRLIPGDHVPRARDLYALDPDVQANLMDTLGPLIDPSLENWCKAGQKLWDFFDPIRQLREGLNMLPLLAALTGHPWLAGGLSLLNASLFAQEGNISGAFWAALGALPLVGLADDAFRALSAARGGGIAVNLGGEGEIVGAINQNLPVILERGWASSRGGQTLSQLQAEGHQFVVSQNTALPFQTGSVRTVFSNNTPIGGQAFLGPGIQAAEVARILQRGGQWIHDGVVIFTKP